jgi:hypothetical protein
MIDRGIPSIRFYKITNYSTLPGKSNKGLLSLANAAIFEQYQLVNNPLLYGLLSIVRS